MITVVLNVIADTMLVVNRTMLDSLVDNGEDLTKVCVSHITDMSQVFENESSFNQDIGNWEKLDVRYVR